MGKYKNYIKVTLAIIVICVIPIWFGIYAGINSHKIGVIENILVGVFIWFATAMTLTVLVKLVDYMLSLVSHKWR